MIISLKVESCEELEQASKTELTGFPYVLQLFAGLREIMVDGIKTKQEVRFYIHSSESVSLGKVIRLESANYNLIKRKVEPNKKFPNGTTLNWLILKKAVVNKTKIDCKLDFGIYQPKTTKECWSGSPELITQNVPLFIEETFNILFGEKESELFPSVISNGNIITNTIFESKRKDYFLEIIKCVREGKFSVNLIIAKNHILIECHPNKSYYVRAIKDLIIEYLSGDFSVLFEQFANTDKFSAGYLPLKKAEGHPDYIIYLLKNLQGKFHLEDSELKKLFNLPFYNLSHFITCVNSLELIGYKPIIKSNYAKLSDDLININLRKKLYADSVNSEFDWDEHQYDCGNDGNDSDNEWEDCACGEFPCICSDRDN